MKYSARKRPPDRPAIHADDRVDDSAVAPSGGSPEAEASPVATKHHRGIKGPLAVLLILLLLVGGGGWYLQRQFDPPGPAGDPIDLVVPEGATTAQISTLLEDRGIVTDARLFRLYLKLNKSGPYRAGSYKMRKNDSFSHAAATLSKGPLVVLDRITIPEGYRLEQIADRVGELPGRSSERFLTAAKSGTVKSKYQPAGNTNLEGLLFPDTYSFERTADELVILREMVAQFERRADLLELDQAVPGTDRTPYEQIIIASLIEREAKLDADRPIVASVINNRLAKGMTLSIDATVLYAQGQHKNRVLNRDLMFESPYNTYLHVGLPPGPIASPGVEALEAAMQPAATDFLYYVTINDCTGETAFGRTGAEHNTNVARRRKENPETC